MSDKLLPCPFCGSIPELAEDDTCRYVVSCCNVHVFGRDDKQGHKFAIKNWNKRARMNKCDCAIGVVINVFDDPMYVNESDKPVNLDDLIFKFDYCPDCGHKNNFDELTK